MSSLQQSAARIVQTASEQAAAGRAVVVMGHNGPTGLGATRSDICGVDFRSEEGDHGDEDLEAALKQLVARDVCVSLVVFGHMHHTLRGGCAGLAGWQVTNMHVR